MSPRLLPLLLAAACGAPSVTPAPAIPASNAGTMDDAILRDFKKGAKLDENGHPINAVVFEAEKLCSGGAGQVVAGGYRSGTGAGVVCKGKLQGLPSGELVFNVRLRPLGIDTTSRDDVVRVTLTKPEPSSVTYTGRSFRADGQWTFVPTSLSVYGEDVEIAVEVFGHGGVELDYIEVFPTAFPVALGPGSRVLTDDDEVTVEGALGGAPPQLTVDGADAHLADLLQSGGATRTDTSYRSVYTIKVGVLAAGRSGDLDLYVAERADAAPTARMRVYRAAPPCSFDGDASGKKVLLTGFQPFPVGIDHDNVSGVAVQALDVGKLTGARVMRLTLPVEYDDAPAIVADAIARCAPDVVIDFGQGGDTISLEHTAYNLKDTGTDVDNRGRFEAGLPIADDGPATESSGLPLDKIKAALAALPPQDAIGTPSVEDSEDPGRYVCNDTFYGAVAAAAGTSTRAGFIHLPYATSFDDAQRAAWGEIVRVAVQATIDRVSK